MLRLAPSLNACMRRIGCLRVLLTDCAPCFIGPLHPRPDLTPYVPSPAPAAAAGLMPWLAQQLSALARQALIPGIKKARGRCRGKVYAGRRGAGVDRWLALQPVYRCALRLLACLPAFAQDCLRALLAVLINTTQNNPAGCRAVVAAGVLEPAAAVLAQLVSGGPKIKGGWRLGCRVAGWESCGRLLCSSQRSSFSRWAAVLLHFLALPDVYAAPCDWLCLACCRRCREPRRAGRVDG